ncbi:unnamed protein product [Notodromas monacha]|uniref:Uncharacterized protein n=1 Tax=Notodromas monacha TaxID=399045 RepID=A0A7R9BIW7_9CRUS|nr:unnamed protein product [Notodromas monacha]CAG0914931.1 unnamed protein product [Notodromas monacha]
MIAISGGHGPIFTFRKGIGVYRSGDEASGEDESSTEEGDHTYESLYDVIGSSNRLDRVSQPGVDNDVVVDGEDVSFDDELFDDSFDSASDDENAKGGTLTVCASRRDLCIIFLGSFSSGSLLACRGCMLSTLVPVVPAASCWFSSAFLATIRNERIASHVQVIFMEFGNNLYYVNRKARLFRQLIAFHENLHSPSAHETIANLPERVQIFDRSAASVVFRNTNRRITKKVHRCGDLDFNLRYGPFFLGGRDFTVTAGRVKSNRLARPRNDFYYLPALR